MFFKKLKMKGKWIMKKKFLIVLMVAAFFLAACEDLKVKVLKEETYTVENVKFKGASFLEDRKIIIDTDKESLVTRTSSNRFIKTSEPNTTVHIQWIKDPGAIPEEFMESTIYVSESDIKKISRAYTDEFEQTMPFEDDKE